MVRVILTSHARQRMFERGISLEQIKDCIELPDFVINKMKNTEAYKQFKNKNLKVVYSKEGKFIKIISVMWR